LLPGICRVSPGPGGHQENAVSSGKEFYVIADLDSIRVDDPLRQRDLEFARYFAHGNNLIFVLDLVKELSLILNDLAYDHCFTHRQNP